MRTCWCRAGRSRYWRARAEVSPAPGRPRDRRFHTGRSRMRGGLAPLRERLCGPTRPSASLPILFLITLEAIDQFVKPVRDALIDDIVVHGAQLLAETSLHVPAQL